MTGGATALVAIVGIVLNWSTGRRITAVELRRIDAENERLHEQHREVGRRARSDACQQLLAALDHIDLTGTGYAISDREAWDDAVSHLYAAINRCHLLAPAAVRRAVDNVDEALREMQASVLRQPGDTDDAFSDGVGRSHAAHRPNIAQRAEALVDQMRGDVARDVADA